MIISEKYLNTENFIDKNKFNYNYITLIIKCLHSL